jgi:hypothetical protein
VLKQTLGSLLALSVALSLSGCAKEAPETKAAPAPEATAAGTPTMEGHPMPVEPAKAVDLSGISRADGGKTIAEVFAGKAELAGQQVIIRAKVVKANANIMGKNWLHVRDGSGAEGTNDLTVTTGSELPKVGDTVIVTGPVVLNKDLGMGYKYEVILEDATVTVEASAT